MDFFPSILSLLLFLEQNFGKYLFVLPVLPGVVLSAVPFWVVRQPWDPELIVCRWTTVPREGA